MTTAPSRGPSTVWFAFAGGTAPILIAFALSHQMALLVSAVLAGALLIVALLERNNGDSWHAPLLLGCGCVTATLMLVKMSLPGNTQAIAGMVASVLVIAMARRFDSRTRDQPRE